MTLKLVKKEAYYCIVFSRINTSKDTRILIRSQQQQSKSKEKDTQFTTV